MRDTLNAENEATFLSATRRSHSFLSAPWNVDQLITDHQLSFLSPKPAFSRLAHFMH